MATASPTPMGPGHFGGQLNRRPSSRQIRQPAQRPTSTRGDAFQNASIEPATGHARHYSLNDSSDDEIPVPFKLSALAKAYLNDQVPTVPTTANDNAQHGLSSLYGAGGSEQSMPKDSPRFDLQTRERTASPQTRASSPMVKRIVRLSRSPRTAAIRRSSPLQSNVAGEFGEAANGLSASKDLSTPSQAPRTVRLPVTTEYGRTFGSSGRTSNRTGSGDRTDAEAEIPDDPATVSRAQLANRPGSVSKYGPSTVNRSRYGDETGVQNSMGVKRIGTGKFFMGVRARRGRRKQSDEPQDVDSGNGQYNDELFPSQEPPSQEQMADDLQQHQEAANEDQTVSRDKSRSPGSFYAPQSRDFGNYGSGSPVRVRDVASAGRVAISGQGSGGRKTEEERRPIAAAPVPRQPRSPQQQVVYKLPAPPLDLPAVHDKENEAPPTFKRNKVPSVVQLSASNQAEKVSKVALRPQGEDQAVMRTAASPERQPLAPRSHNTPLRPAPAPPKMSILEAATATAGAATASQGTKKRSTIRVNGKYFTRMEVIGRGGSSRVWKVMAENGKVFALKKVNLEHADEAAVRGFKGEIDLLKRLEGNDRVIRILDYEINEEKESLSVLMDLGEIDFNKILRLHLNGDKFEPSFTRHYWKEMLECIQAVHEHDIVHTDLKPENFVLVQGRLKLIDFGIANAIQTDETVNIHRDSQVGTPNYMSPESLLEVSDPSSSKGSDGDQPKLLKLGKPSDIWSLGCILYQMAYGQQPFAHIQNQMARCRAIINWNYAIEFRPLGLGGVPLPAGLIRTMKRCLNRDQHQRPTVAELLADSNPFLHPVECGENTIPMTEELLGRILRDVANRCRDRTPTEAELLSLWPASYFASIRKSVKDTA